MPASSTTNEKVEFATPLTMPTTGAVTSRGSAPTLTANPSSLCTPSVTRPAGSSR